jgi:hypothetical protein
MFFYLVQHPDVKVSKFKEAHYCNSNYHNVCNRYTGCFPIKWKSYKKIMREVSAYYIYNPQGLKIISKDYPKGVVIKTKK